ncbi:MAG: 30S ribosomal protein S4e [Candidatus Woesearchaeota archaeon]
MKNHFKTLATPRTWRINRKKKVFVIRSFPSGHPVFLSMPISIAIRQLGFAETAKEARYILNKQEVLVDGKRIKKQKFAVGFLDVLSFPLIKKWYRMTLNKKGLLELISIDEKESTIKPCKIKNKTALGGKVQLNLSDGKNVLVDKDSYKRGDSVLLNLQNNSIISHLPFTKGASIIIMNGKNIGHVGTIERIDANKILYKDKEGEIKETAKSHAYVVGKEKPEISLP